MRGGCESLSTTLMPLFGEGDLGVFQRLANGGHDLLQFAAAGQIPYRLPHGTEGDGLTLSPIPGPVALYQLPA